MGRDFEQITWSPKVLASWLKILEMAIEEDLGSEGDLTSQALVPEDAVGAADIVARQSGVLAGEPAIRPTLARFDTALKWTPAITDGQRFEARQTIGRIEGPARGILAAERPVLNFLSRMAGIATLTRSYVDAIQGTKARIYDTRKTTPGWRLLEKYAVRCGGGCNHRHGLHDAVLIKDNHLPVVEARLKSLAKEISPPAATAALIARQYLQERFGAKGDGVIVEVEMDTLDRFNQVLAQQPDIILLDNMDPGLLASAVEMRDVFTQCIYAAIAAASKQVVESGSHNLESDRDFHPSELEASGGVNLKTVRAIARSGVDRISVGALTHSAVAIDFGLDWR